MSAKPVPHAWAFLKMQGSDSQPKHKGISVLILQDSLLVGLESECLFLVYITFPHGLSFGIYELLWGNSSYLHQSLWILGLILRCQYVGFRVIVKMKSQHCHERCQHSGIHAGLVLIVDIVQTWAVNKKRRREEQITAS